MVDAHLGDLPPVADAAGEQLRRDHRPVGGQLDPADRAGADELERAVDVHHPEPERPPREPAPRATGGAAGEPVLAIDAVAGDEVVAGRERQQADELGQVELAVAVGQQIHGIRAASIPERTAAP